MVVAIEVFEGIASVEGRQGRWAVKAANPKHQEGFLSKLEARNLAMGLWAPREESLVVGRYSPV